ncbi:DUF721 domain-containing protein [Candidatus Fermentibacterales bacterium]|nr:DUF721 domain-containing protein [Candidatus Fermentibacterales bacterium]
MPEKISDVVARLMGRLGAADGAERARALTGYWQDAVGEQLAKITELRGFRGDVVLVRALHPLAAQELRLREKSIVASLNARAGRRFFVRIRVVSGKPEGPRRD